MLVVHERCCGLDIHQRRVVACVLLTAPDGTVHRHTRTFGTMTADLLAVDDAAAALLAEIGTDMSRYPSHKHLTSWAGVCPGNKESGGRRPSGKTTKGNVWLRAILGEVAWAAVRTGTGRARISRGQGHTAG